MIVFPKAKINLGLSVIEKRPDGFHNVETAMIPINLLDILEIIPNQSGSTHFEMSGLTIAGDRKNNLVMKAWNIMQKKYDLPGVDIHLHKVIPSGAGLGGGSSDAAAVIRICNDLFNLKLHDSEMESLVRPLGSDCAFFIRSRPALASDKGDQLSPLALNLDNLTIILVKPEVHIDTAKAYSWVVPSQKKSSLAKIIYAPVETWKGNLINDFEIPVFDHHPQIQQIRDKLYEKGALYASLTGTGAAVFGLFDRDLDLENEFPNDFFWKGKV